MRTYQHKGIMKKLLIVESPAKIKTIKKFLGDDFRIISTMGHIKDLPTKKTGVQMDDKGIKIEYVTIENKDNVIADIRKNAKNVDEVYIAPDPDREGEIIAWHVEQEIKDIIKDPSKIHRITFNEITKPAILDAIAHPYHVDMKKVGAQQARRILDRWVGYEVSPVLWQKIAKGLSAGRVQSVALRLIVEREEAIRNFKPEEYWSVEGLFAKAKSELAAMLTHIGKEKAELKNKEQTDTIVKDIKKESFIVDSITDKTRIQNPVAPFMTSTLQQAAFNKLGYTVKKTMTIAQQLYEGVPLDDPNTPKALITYMRTDSLRLSDTAITQARNFISSQFGKEYLPSQANVYVKDGKAQDAHEAIRPIDISLTPNVVSQYLKKDLAMLYELIWQRSVACQMTPAKYAQRQVTIMGGKYTFKVTGSTLIFDGYLKAYNSEEEGDEDKKNQSIKIPNDLKIKDPVDLKKISPKQHFTQPPPRYTEGSLVKEMEKEGIGRPSTYATILSTIQARTYVKLDTKKRFEPTDLGMQVTDMLRINLPEIMNVKFTALMEEDLDKIAEGEMERDALLREFYTAFQKDLTKFKGSESQKISIPTDIQCPQCHEHNLVIRKGKTGEFLGCPGYPNCDFSSNFEQTETGEIKMIEQTPPQLLDEKCPKCGEPMREMMGKFGKFIACSGYPKCKYIKQNMAGFKCPECQKGDIIERKWRGGTFWGCSNYPKCKFAIFDEIENTPCPKCKRPFLIKKKDKEGNISIFCSDIKECGYKK
ncbi:MAG: topoisomerase protein [candidate division TM6 bacterium GW2011_GWF2_32_72]|nr:MAG: topoisomerase protein [candidate division TM6 bacterium GW2011_GWF2_32_72]